jgi:hypothetical protein
VGRSIKIVKLSIAEAPQKCCEADGTQGKRSRDQKKKDRHAALRSKIEMPGEFGWGFVTTTVFCLLKPSPSRNEFAMTMIDDVDIATAAISGEASPSMATGTARQL